MSSRLHLDVTGGSDMSTIAHADPLHLAFLELLRWTLLAVRNNSGDSKLCFAHADHMHNVPGLLADFHPDQLAYYWEFERPHFLRALKAMGMQPPDPFNDSWNIIEDEYFRCCPSSAASQRSSIASDDL